MKKMSVLFATIVLCIVALPILSVKSQEPRDKLRRVGNPIPNQYIVVLNDDALDSEVTSIADEFARTHGGLVKHVYRYAVKGFSLHQMPEAAARALSLDPRVEFIEENSLGQVTDTQFNPPWNLDRIDQRNLPPNGTYTYNQTGTGVRAYVLDTGMRTTHQDFGSPSRAFFAADFLGGNGTDCFNQGGGGHGTPVAGQLGGTTYGVAKNVSLYNLRICDCNGTCPADVTMAGVDWVTNNHIKPAVANMSLRLNSISTAVEKAVRRSIASGVTYVVAAGNDNGDNAGNYTPARITQAITVGATGNDAPGANPVSDQRASFSNIGSVLDLFAPGVKTTSIFALSDTLTGEFGGTSAATPQVAGAAALYLQTDPTACPSTVSDVITTTATSGVVINPGAGSPNRLLYVPPSWPTPTFHSLSLNGTSAYVDVPNNAMGVSLNLTGPLTVEAWVRVNTSAVTQSVITRYNPLSGAGTFDGGYALKVISSGKARFWIYKNAAEFTRVTSNTTLLPGVWYHLAGVYDGSQIRIYVNGVLEASTAATVTPATQSVNLRLGANVDGTDLFNGLIDEARVTEAAVYGGNFAPQNRITGVAKTRGLWRFDRQNARDCADVNNGTLVGGATFSTVVP